MPDGQPQRAASVGRLDSELELALAAGVAVVETVAPLLPGRSVGLHWPNDVFASGRKLSGNGRELGVEGLDQFRHTKMVLIDPEIREQQGWFPYADSEAWPG